MKKKKNLHKVNHVRKKRVQVKMHHFLQDGDEI